MQGCPFGIASAAKKEVKNDFGAGRPQMEGRANAHPSIFEMEVEKLERKKGTGNLRAVRPLPV